MKGNMPDVDGNQKTSDAPETSLHAHADGREEDAKPGSRGVSGQEGGPDEASYQDGGHQDSAEFGDTPAATGPPDAPAADAGAHRDPSDPESPAAADAARTPRGVPAT